MISQVWSTAPPLDDFLAGASSGGDGLRRVGQLMSLAGTLLATGFVVHLAITHIGRRSEIRLLLRLAGYAGALMLIGGAVELVGISTAFELAWSDVLELDVGSAAMLRLLGGLLVALGLFEHTVPIGPAKFTESTIWNDEHRWLPSSASAFGMVGAALGTVSFMFDGHTVTEGPRLVHALVNTVHVGAGAVWVGGLAALVIVAVRRRRDPEARPVSALVVRFSRVASIALAAVAVAGVAMTLMIIDGLGDITGTQWGQRLIVKTGTVAVAAAIGAYNHFVVVPRLDAEANDDALIGRARLSLLVEAAVLLAVVVATAWLVNGSTT